MSSMLKMPRRSDEKVLWSRLTVRMSSKQVIDQNPPSSGTLRLRTEVHRRLALHPREELIGRAVIPHRRVGQVDAVEVP